MPGRLPSSLAVPASTLGAGAVLGRVHPHAEGLLLREVFAALVLPLADLKVADRVVELVAEELLHLIDSGGL